MRAALAPAPHLRVVSAVLVEVVTNGLVRMGRDSIFVMSMSRSANTDSALKSCPGPSCRRDPRIDVNHRDRHATTAGLQAGAVMVALLKTTRLEREDDGGLHGHEGLVHLGVHQRVSRQHDEARHVVLVVLDVLLQDVESVELRSKRQMTSAGPSQGRVHACGQAWRCGRSKRVTVFITWAALREAMAAASRRFCRAMSCAAPAVSSTASRRTLGMARRNWSLRGRAGERTGWDAMRRVHSIKPGAQPCGCTDVLPVQLRVSQAVQCSSVMECACMLTTGRGPEGGSNTGGRPSALRRAGP